MRSDGVKLLPLLFAACVWLVQAKCTTTLTTDYVTRRARKLAQATSALPRQPADSSEADLHQQFPAPPPVRPVPSNETLPPSYAAICLVVKDQSEHLREWLFYHHWLGFRTIYLYDHNSRTPLNLGLLDWIRSGVLHYTAFAGQHNVQPVKLFYKSAQGHVYSDCLKRARNRHRWLAFIDADEYLVLSNPTGPNPIRSLLRSYEPYGALAVNWRVFGSSGHITPPTLPTMLAYTRCIPDDVHSHNVHVKVIANVAHTKKISSTPHTFKYYKDYYAVTEQYTRCDVATCSPVTAQHVILHHYIVLSREEFKAKQARGGGSGSKKGWDFFDRIDAAATSNCSQGVHAFDRCYTQAGGGKGAWQQQGIQR